MVEEGGGDGDGGVAEEGVRACPPFLSLREAPEGGSGVGGAPGSLQHQLGESFLFFLAHGLRVMGEVVEAKVGGEVTRGEEGGSDVLLPYV